MSSDSDGQVHQGVEFLALACPHNREQAFDGTFAVFAAGATHDLPPLNGGPERALGGVVGRFDAVLVHEAEEMLVVYRRTRRPSCGRPHWSRSDTARREQRAASRSAAPCRSAARG